MHIYKVFIFLVFLCLLNTLNPGYATEKTYSVSGTLTFKVKGDIYIYLVNEEVFSTPMKGFDTVVLKTEEPFSGSSTKSFRFENVKAGLYGIRCFQDVNGNGKLDRGLFGPSEPWGMSWNSEKPLKWPKFEKISFQVNENLLLKPIVLE